MSDSSPPLYVRKLSAIERYNLVINEIVRYNVDAVLEGSGELDLEQWRRAVKIAAEANPGTRVRLKSFLGFAKWVDSGITPEVELVSAPEWDGLSEAGTEFMQSKFDVLNGGPVCDIKLLPGNPARIVFRGLHGAMDARGLTHFIEDILRVLNGEQPIGSRATITDREIRLEHQDKITATPPPATDAIPAMPVVPPQSDKIRYIWRRVTVSKNVTNILPKMAVFLAAQARKHASGDVAFTIPVDFRGLRHDVASTANLTGYLRISVTPEDKPRDVMRRINEQIRQYADCISPGYLNVLPWMPIKLLTKSLADKASDLLHTTNGELPTGGIVSLGHFKAEALSYPGFTALRGFGIPGSVGKLNVVIHNYSDGMEVIFSTPESYNREGQLDALIEQFLETFDPDAVRNQNEQLSTTSA